MEFFSLVYYDWGSYYFSGANIHRYTGVFKGSIFFPALAMLYVDDLLDDVIYNIVIYVDDSNLHC